MGRIFVISDVHGYYDLFIKLLNEISFNDLDKLYVIGDVCDRGEDSLKLLFYTWKQRRDMHDFHYVQMDILLPR